METRSLARTRFGAARRGLGLITVRVTLPVPGAAGAGCRSGATGRDNDPHVKSKSHWQTEWLSVTICATNMSSNSEAPGSNDCSQFEPDPRV